MTKNLMPFLLGAVLIAAACADPAADAPQAEVSEPVATESPAPAPAAATVYAFSDDSTIAFVGSKVTGSHSGGFKSFDGSVSVSGTTPEGAGIEVNIDTTSLWSDNEKLAGHLQSADFFDVATYPTASFTSTAIAVGDEGGYNVTGNLDLHGVTKQITFPATIELGDSGFTASAEFAIKRFDFGIVYPGKTDDLIRDDVLIQLDLRSAMADGGMAEESEPAEG